MKVIKYGPGYESKRITCDICKSELEYRQEDIQCYNSTVKCEDNDYRTLFLDYINCPVCSQWIELSKELINISNNPPQPPPLRNLYERFKQPKSKGKTNE